MNFTHASLFSGIGGFDYAAQLMGWQNLFHCEWNQFCKKVLAYHFPNSIPYHDITKTDFTIHRGCIDILTGGFPCQPYSRAGKQKGTEDHRHLWPEMLRAIGEIEPTFVVGENVPGLVDWNDGLVFEQVQTDLENKGFEVIPFILPASGVEAGSMKGPGFGLLPTASAMDANGIRNLRQTTIKGLEKGWLKDMSLTHFMIAGLLPTPTPTARDTRSGFMKNSPAFLKRMTHSKGVNLHEYIQRMIDGENFQLNPPFVLEMMGFPPDWTELPFLNGEVKASKQEEMQ